MRSGFLYSPPHTNLLQRGMTTLCLLEMGEKSGTQTVMMPQFQRIIKQENSLDTSSSSQEKVFYLKLDTDRKSTEY